MIWLIAIAVLITAGTVWYLIRPLSRRPRREDSEAYHQLMQVRERLLAQLNELDVEVGDRNLDSAVVSDERRRLEAELAQVLRELETLSDDKGPANSPSDTRKLHGATLATLAVALPVLTLSLYTINHPPNPIGLFAESQADDAGIPPMVLQMVAQLERRLAEQPNDAAGWARLGRAYQVLQRDVEAKEAYARAARQAPGDSEILDAYGTLLIRENPRDPSPEAVTLYTRLYKLDPKNPGALWVLGLNAFINRDFKGAVRFWESLIKVLPPNSEVEPELRKAIAEARAQALKK